MLIGICCCWLRVYWRTPAAGARRVEDCVTRCWSWDAATGAAWLHGVRCVGCSCCCSAVHQSLAVAHIFNSQAERWGCLTLQMGSSRVGKAGERPFLVTMQQEVLANRQHTHPQSQQTAVLTVGNHARDASIPVSRNRAESHAWRQTSMHASHLRLKKHPEIPCTMLRGGSGSKSTAAERLTRDCCKTISPTPGTLGPC